MSIIEDQKDFMLAAGQTTEVFNAEQTALYDTLVEEEAEELFNTVPGSAEGVKEAVDVIVVALGYLISTGIDVQKAWNLVHENNMLKVTGKKEYDENGKVKKSAASIAAKNEMMEVLQQLVSDAQKAGEYE